MIAPIASVETSDDALSNHQSFGDLPIQITSIAVVVNTNPSHTQNAHAIPFSAPDPPIAGDVVANRYTTANT